MTATATATATKERPIRFSGPMVRALLDGTKTQTRRVVEPQPSDHIIRTTLDGKPMSCFWEPGMPIVRCPYGRIGDRLWVRETWAANATLNTRKPHELQGETIYYRATYDNDSHFVWRPSIHMPRWASRITLEITDVRVERLRSISGDDAIAEGCGNDHDDPEIALSDFCLLWDRINGSRPGCSWDANPWVWAITFRRVGASA